MDIAMVRRKLAEHRSISFDRETVARLVERIDRFAVRERELLEANNRYLERWRSAERALRPVAGVRDEVVDEVRRDLLDRSQLGIAKYGTTLARTDLKLPDWLQHTYEETLDQANYLKRCIVELRARADGGADIVTRHILPEND